MLEHSGFTMFTRKSHSSHHPPCPQEVLAQFSLYVHKGGPETIIFISFLHVQLLWDWKKEREQIHPHSTDVDQNDIEQIHPHSTDVTRADSPPQYWCHESRFTPTALMSREQIHPHSTDVTRADSPLQHWCHESRFTPTALMSWEQIHPYSTDVMRADSPLQHWCHESRFTPTALMSTRMI